MFKKKQPAQPDTQIPYQLYQTIQEPTVRRRRWIAEILLGAVIVAGLAVAGILLYDRLYHKKSVQPILPESGTNAAASQSPQDNDSREQPQINQPVAVPENNSTNTGQVAPPEQ